MVRAATGVDDRCLSEVAWGPFGIELRRRGDQSERQTERVVMKVSRYLHRGSLSESNSLGKATCRGRPEKVNCVSSQSTPGHGIRVGIL